MAHPQDRSDNAPDTTPEHAPGAAPTPPAPPSPPTEPSSPPETAPPEPPEHAAEMAPPPAKKAPAKKAPAKAAKKSPQGAPKKAPAKKAAAKKAPAKKAAKKAPAKNAPAKKAAPPRIDTNGQLAAGAKDAAAHAKSTVEAARNPVSGEVARRQPVAHHCRLAVAIVVSLLALLLVRQLRQRGERDG